MKYRSEIDGLRALAVLPVILFHAGFELFSGGYVGVDVFFVISGYLITSLLIVDLEKNSFSISYFYERRARRLLPALFLVMFISSIAAWFLMMPAQLESFSKSLIAVSIFFSNFLFFSETGYFELAAEEKPLLHTWSLAVEEQYYLLFPLFLFFIWKLGKKNIFLIILLISIMSLFVSEWGWRNSPSGNFFLAPSRAWEILAGSLAAITYKEHINKNNEFLSIVGFLFILLSIFIFDQNTPFPSIYTLLPVIGTVLIILYGGKHTFISKVLSIKVIVTLGLMSYSAYLWHHPIFAYSRILMGDNLSTLIILFGIFATFILAFISWRFIEKPFRNKKIISRRGIWVFSSAGIIFFIILGIIGLKNDGFSSRIKIDSKLSNQERAVVEHAIQNWGTTNYPPHYLSQKENGFTKFGNGDKKIVLLGDSHATQYSYAFGSLLERKDPLFNDKSVLIKQIDFPPSISQLNLPKGTTTVALSFFWSFRYKDDSVDPDERLCKADKKECVFSDSVKDKNDLKIRSFISELKKQGYKVYLILDNPFGNELSPEGILEISRDFGLSADLSENGRTELKKLEFIERRGPINKRLHTIINDLSINAIDPIESLCDETICIRTSKEYDYLLYKDYDHFSIQALVSEVEYIYQILD